MALAIATNTGALMAAASATSVNKDMETSMERLSTGKRINSASDDAAGVAIASRLSSEIRGTNQAIRNAQDGQALINTAEGAHKEVENILQRMRELAVQSANDTNDSTDRTNLQAEMDQLTNEIDRISNVTTWAGQNLLTGTGGTGGNGEFEFQIGAATGTSDTITVDINSISSSSLNVSGSAAAADFVDADGNTDGSGSSALTGVTRSDNVITASGDGSADVVIAIGETTVTVAEGDLTDMTSGGSSAGELELNTFATELADALNENSDFAGFTAVASTDGSGDVTILKGGLDLSSTSASQSAIDKIDTAIGTLNTQRATLGAVSNRLDNTVSNLTNVAINLEGGKGRIEDADFAAESTSLAKSQILQQASTAMLAQANASKQNVLSLLQG